MSGGEAIRYAVDDGIGVVTIDRPDKLNAMTWAMIEALIGRVEAAAADRGVRAIVIRGEGRAFGTGFDLADAAATGQAGQAPLDDRRSFQRAAGYWRRLWQAPKPVIVAVQGHCLAAALEIVLHADLAIAADTARFGYPAVLASGLPDTHMFAYRIGPLWTRRLLMTGQPIDAATAARIGLVLEVVPEAELLPAAMALAHAVARVPGPILEGVKNVVNQSTELMGYSALQQENWNQSALARAAPEVAEFERIARAEGLKAALAWRADGGPLRMAGA